MLSVPRSPVTCMRSCATAVQVLSGRIPRNVCYSSYARKGCSPLQRANSSIRRSWWAQGEREHRQFSTSAPSDTAATSSNVPEAPVAEPVERPSNKNLLIYALHCALPMVGFGFMDNLVMIQVGEVIDSSIGVTFGFATMTSAALGQVCSDVSGVCFGGVVDAAFAKVGLPRYDLSPAQILSQQVRVVRTAAMGIGVASGCLLGMTSLLFMDLDKADRLKRQKELKTIFKTLAEKGGDLMQCERVGLYMLDQDNEHLWTMGRKWSSSVAEGMLDNKIQPTQQQMASVLRAMHWSEQEIKDVLPEDRLATTDANKLLQDIMGKDETRIPLRPHGTKWLCVKEKRILNIADVGQDTRFSRSQTVKMMPKAWRSESALVGPVINEDGEVVGVVEMINKLDSKGRVISFSMEDERLMNMLCHHCGLFVNNV